MKSVCIGYRGAPNPTVLFVGEAPGSEEDRVGKAFVGAAGQLLDLAIQTYGINRVPWGVTNICRCRPPGNRKPRVKEVKACGVYLRNDLVRLKPKIVVPLGGTALEAITGEKKITDVAGRILEHPRFVVYPILHPAAVLRMEKWKVAFEAQFKGLQRLVHNKPVTPRNYVHLQLGDAIERLKRLAIERGEFGIDVETGGKGRAALNPKAGRILTCAISTKAGEGFWFEWDDEIVYPLGNLLRSGATMMVAHNAVFEVKWLLWHVIRKMHGLTAARTIEWPIKDSMLFYYLLHEDAKGMYGLEHLSRELTDMGGYDDKIAAYKAEGKEWTEIPVEDLGDYNAGDADATLRCARRLEPQLKRDPKLWSVWEKILQPSVFAIAWTELHGRRVDPDRVVSLRGELKAEMGKAKKVVVAHPATQAYALTRPPGTLNINSSDQIGAILFDGVKVPCLGKTETGKRSVLWKYLNPFTKKYPIVKSYLDWKERHTLLNNYLDPIADMVMPDGFLYGSYLLHGTETGRPSSRDPNLQNFTGRLRDIVCSRFPLGSIVSADFSQNELRLMSWVSKCKPLLEAYQKGDDVHALTATKVCTKLFDREVSLAEVKTQHAEAEASGGKLESWRQEYGKRPNFALVYGARPGRFAEEFGLSIELAEKVCEAWYASYPEIPRWLSARQSEVKTTGRIRSHLGRLRRLPEAMGDYEWGDPAKKEQIHALLAGSNFPIQSLSSDINTLAFVRVARWLANNRLRAVAIGLTHDSIDLDVPEEEVDKVASVLHRLMVADTHTLMPWLGVPLDIDVKVGRTWGSLKKWKPKGSAA